MAHRRQLPPLPGLRPDLVIKKVDVLPGGIVKVVVKNQGFARAGVNKLAMRVSRNSQVLGHLTANVPALLPGQSTTVTLQLSPTTQFGFGRLRLDLMVDASKIVRELNENNNTFVKIVGN